MGDEREDGRKGRRKGVADDLGANGSAYREDGMALHETLAVL